MNLTKELFPAEISITVDGISLIFSKNVVPNEVFDITGDSSIQY